MLKAILSRKELSENKEYLSFISDLLDSKAVQKLAEFRHHIGTTRFQHSLNVSYYNYKLCKLLKLDYKSAARAGLLHDLFLYERKNHVNKERSHSAEHSKIALRNASRLFTLNKREQDMILNHMWPLTTAFPQYSETYVITLVDKLCAIAEFMEMVGGFTGRKLRSAQAMLLFVLFSVPID